MRTKAPPRMTKVCTVSVYISAASPPARGPRQRRADSCSRHSRVVRGRGKAPLPGGRVSGGGGARAPAPPLPARPFPRPRGTCHGVDHGDAQERDDRGVDVPAQSLLDEHRPGEHVHLGEGRTRRSGPAPSATSRPAPGLGAAPQRLPHIRTAWPSQASPTWPGPQEPVTPAPRRWVLRLPPLVPPLQGLPGPGSGTAPSQGPPASGAHRDLGEDVQKQREHGQVEADAAAAEALAQVLRHRDDARGQVHGREEPAQQQHHEQRLRAGASAPPPARPPPRGPAAFPRLL